MRDTKRKRQLKENMADINKKNTGKREYERHKEVKRYNMRDKKIGEER
jgi:hypothetical protein